LPPLIGQPWPSPLSRARSATEARAAAALARAKPSATTAVGKDESEALPIRLEVILPPDQPRHSYSPLLSILLHPSSPACGVSLMCCGVLYLDFRGGSMEAARVRSLSGITGTPSSCSPETS
jgi:hypothetical protein